MKISSRFIPASLAKEILDVGNLLGLSNDKVEEKTINQVNRTRKIYIHGHTRLTILENCDLLR